MVGRKPPGELQHGHLPIEQPYRCLVFDNVILWNHGDIQCIRIYETAKWQRSSHVMHPIPITSTIPTILKLAYFISHLSSLDTDPHPELNSGGNAIYLRSAPTDKGPKIPDPNYGQPQRTSLSSADVEKSSRRLLPFPKSSPPKVLHLDITHFTSLWMARNIELWPHRICGDGSKYQVSYSEHEITVHYYLLEMWGNVIPNFLGFGH